jgi:hypothetical protein
VSGVAGLGLARPGTADLKALVGAKLPL